ncbi:MAG TPA: ABC transporter permease [Candidatus Dormibacteraeota bacterium]|nr:ABC transporter permease [Candidatus Dormibacteraeota bacterium]
MIASILAFEFSRRLRRISTYIYFLVFFTLGLLFVLMSGGAFSSATVDFGTGGKVLVTSPFTLNLIIMYMSFFGVIVVAALAGQATYQDLDSNSTAFFYTAPISKFDYLAGRFLGALAVQVVVFSSVGLGAWAGTRVPWLDPARVGPQTFYSYAQPYLTMVIPNLIFMSAIFFSLAALGKKMLPVYAGSVLLLIGYFVAGQLSSDLTTSTLAAMIDPFGGNAVSRLTQYWTPFQRNTEIVPFAGVLLWNRMLWMGVGAAILGLTYSRFSFTYAAGKSTRKRKPEPAPESLAVAAQILPTVHPTFGPGESLAELVSLTRLQFSETVKNIFFVVLLLAGALMDIAFAFNVNSPLSTPVYPVTARMVELGGAGFTVFILAIITFYSGELVWRERDAKLNQIMDALPVRRWVLFGSKLFALMLVQILLVLMVMVCGLLVQAVQGYHHFEIGLYLTDLFALRLITFWILCVIAMLVHTIVNNKYLGHFVMVLYFIVTVVALPQTNFQDYLYRLGQSPQAVYSDMNGYGPYAAPLFWFHLYWGIGAVLLAILTNLLWVRGMETSIRNRAKLARARLTNSTKLAFAVCGVLFAGVGGYIYYNTHVQNRFLTTFKFQEDRAQYEKKYKQYQTMPHPRITDIQVNVDLHPEERLAVFSGKEELENKTDAPIDRIALTLWPQDADLIPRPHTEVRQLSFEGGQTPVLEDTALGFYIYQLAKPLPPHGRIALDFELAYPNPGFVNSRPNGDIVHNGSFVSSSYLPVVGYLQDVQLVDDSARRSHGLPKSAGLPKLEDVAARQNNYGSAATDWVNAEGTVSTSPDQIAIMPGYLQKEWVQDGRRYFHYKADAPILDGWLSINSARYAVQRDRWHDVNLEIYYHPGHEFDLDRMMLGMKSTLDYCTTSFSPFQFRQLRIIEFPRYGDFAESFPNTIPFSESIGFITYVDPKKKDAINLPFFVTAHEVGHQWWAHQVMSANTEGATAIVETLAQYTALMVMRHTYGPESMKKFMRYQLDGYLRGRAQERDEEKPLLRVEPNQGYIHYNKGGQVMYALQDYIGEERVSQALAAMVKDWGFKGPPYPTSLDMENYLQKVTPPEFQYLYEDWFENITIFDNRAVSATYAPLPDGKYQVHISVEAKKYRADGKGEEHLIAVHDLVDIGVLDADGKFLYLQKQKIEQEHQDFTVTVDKVPSQAGIDPLIKLIDRNPDDNVVNVEKR